MGGAAAIDKVTSYAETASQVQRRGEADVTRGGRQINTMKEGDFFGEIALVTKMPRTATVTAKTDVDVLVITERAFDGLLKKQPEIGRAVAESAPTARATRS